MSHVAAEWRITEVGANGTKQANFLQKLYDFLSIDPHPYPDVIYWAADSRQLVIAQPDRLVKEILPKLFKHDKLSSFGRQLNIYGFTRQFPGRQFKDSGGKISDASVWAHPTLHRLSSSKDISSIKRRAAPKLFRTRRLANGQVVRTRAGPAVEAKFREVRESIAESRRRRGSLASTYSDSMHREESAEPQYLPLSAQDHALSPAMSIPSALPPTPSAIIPPQTPIGRFRNASAGSLGEHKPRLADIQEGVVADDVTPPSLFFGLRQSHGSIGPPLMAAPPAEFNVQVETITQGQTQPASIVPMGFGTSPTEPHPGAFSPQGPPPMVSATATATSTERKLQSCPASIHTTPIPAFMSLQQAGVELASSQSFSLTSTSPLTQTGGSLGLIHIDTVQTQIDAQARNRIDSIQSTDFNMTPTSAGSTWPSALPLHTIDGGPQYAQRGSWTSMASSMPARLSDTIPPASLTGRPYNLDPQAQAVWPPQFQAVISSIPTQPYQFDPRASIQEVPMPLTIDPRWVSPGTSTNSTPSQTPGLQFSNPFENVPMYVSPVDPVPRSNVIQGDQVEPMQVDQNVQYQEYPGMACQQVRMTSQIGTQSYPPGQGGRKRMEVRMGSRCA